MKNFLNWSLYFLFVWLVPSVRIYGQDDLKFENLTTEQGLSNHFVMSIMQDRKGFLWFGTGTGLDKYDGYRFTNYKFDPRNTTSLTKNQVITLYEDREGFIWVGTSEGTCRFDPRTETFTRLEQSSSNPYAFKYAQSFNEDGEGNLWVGGSYEGALRKVDRKTGKFSATNYAAQLGIDSSGQRLQLHLSFRDKAGTLWVGSPTGLHRLNLTPVGKGKPSKVSFTHYRHDPADPKSLSQNFVTGIYEDRRGVLWILNEEGVLHAFDRKSGQFTRYPLDPTRKIVLHRRLRTSISEDREGNLWIGTSQNGLYKVDKGRQVITPYVHNPDDPGSIIHNSLFSLLVDRSGILWATTMRGVIKLDPNRKPFALYRNNPVIPHSLSQDHITAICEDRTGVVWIGTSGGGLNALNKATGQFTHYWHDSKNPSSLRYDVVGAILEDRNGTLWVGSGDVLYRFDRKQGVFTHHSLHHNFLFNPSTSPIFTMYEDREGLIWLGTNNGIIRFNPNTGHILNYPFDPDHPERISDYWALAILEDRKGNLWIGPGSQALTRFDRKTGRFTQYKHDSRKPGSISSTTIPSIYEVSKGTLWFGTGEGGLCRFDPITETFTTFTEQQGQAGNSVFSFVEDNAGNLWLGTNKGLFKRSLSKQTFTNYSADEGLQGNMFTSLYTEGAAFKGKDGTLYFGGSNGFNAFDPTKIKSNTYNTYVPPIVITQVKLFDKLLPGRQEAREIRLDYNQNFISFEFAALNYTNSPKNQYAYHLEGLEKEWVYSGSRRVASYTDLGPGEYDFRIKGSNNDGVWNEQGTSIRLIIQPPWWRTLWAYLLYTGVFIASIWTFIAYRSRTLRRENRLLEEKVAMRTEQIQHQKEEIEAQRDNLEQTLTELKSTQQQLIQKEKMASLGELTAGIAHEIQNPLNFVNNLAEVSTELVDELKEERRKPERDDELQEELLTDLEDSLQKITHHGKRADSIVKGILQHSRSSSGEKQPTDLNVLVEEYLRLAYQWQRAKHKDFTADLRLDLDPDLGRVLVAPQEIGRVLLNLFNNAFYAVAQQQQQAPIGYQPSVSIRTHHAKGHVEIRVIDNGLGIPEAIKTKIFQPFFTTKPTGEGTGLGLSISYDIITKGHGGTLRIESVPEQSTEFIVTLPNA